MQHITLTKHDDGSIEVVSDKNPNGSTSWFFNITDDGERFMVALADHLGFEASELLNLESIQDAEWGAKS